MFSSLCIFTTKERTLQIVKINLRIVHPALPRDAALLEVMPMVLQGVRPFCGYVEANEFISSRWFNKLACCQIKSLFNYASWKTENCIRKLKESKACCGYQSGWMNLYVFHVFFKIYIIIMPLLDRILFDDCCDQRGNIIFCFVLLKTTSDWHGRAP